MTPEEIVAKFADALEQFEPIDGQPYDTDLMRIREVMAQLLLQITYDETGGTSNLLGTIRPVAAYTTRYGAEFVEPKRAGSYNAMIDNDATAVVSECMKAAHKAKRANRGTYRTARQETAQFILAVVKYTWVREL